MKTRKLILTAICLFAALALTACHMVVKPVDEFTIVMTPTPTPVGFPQPSPQVVLTDAPARQTEQPAQPGGSDEPGLNG